MNRYIAEFEKVSFEQFKKDVESLQIAYKYNWENALRCNYDIKDIYDNIKLPVRATCGSAGYDFFSPFPLINLECEHSVAIPTGIKCKIDNDWTLILFPKSGLGNNYRLKLDGTVGIIDADYYNCENNEGHILVKLTNHDSCHRSIMIPQGKSYCQGIFFQYGLTKGDNVTYKRVGGFGSTGK